MTTEIDAEGLAEIRVLAGNIRDRSPRSGVAHHEAERILEILRRATTRTSEAEPVAEDPLWQKLRDILGLDGWYDGQWQGIATHEMIVTHVQHVANERARLLFASTLPTPASDDQVEAVARALYEENDAWSAGRPWPELSGEEAEYRRLARAVLAAMGSTKP